MQDHIQWVTAAPLWEAFSGDPAKMQRPALLRFEADTFMQDLTARLQTPQPTLTDLVARPKSYRARPVGAPANWTPPLEQLKLYQPIHGHFYLVTASLVCRTAGLPDRAINPAQNEKISFVLRRLKTGTNEEMAWLSDPSRKGWQLLEGGRYETLAEGEELYPLFPMNFRQNDHKRRLLVGLIPTSSRDSFQAAPQLSPLGSSEQDPTTKKVKDPRLEELDTRILDRLAELKPLPNPPQNAEQKARSEQQKEASRFMLLDLGDFLSQHLPGLWQAIMGQTLPTRADERAIYQLFAGWRVENGAYKPFPSWLEALRVAWQEWERISGESDDAPSQSYDLGNAGLTPALLANLRKQLVDALGPYTPPATTPDAGPPVPKLDARPEVRYIIRCVYQRPNCRPPHPDILSSPGEPFALATFFDFDAPSRPIRITMPVDTSVAGLRKFNKNVAFLISDQLREQMSRVTDLQKALDGDLASGEEFDLGEICSFSIPIISICALIVLMIFINLLNLVFWWLPFLRFCLPLGLLSKLKAKT